MVPEWDSIIKMSIEFPVATIHHDRDQTVIINYVENDVKPEKQTCAPVAL